MCVSPLDGFLDRHLLNQSFHHSGKAGYCRLFLSGYFQILAQKLSNCSISAELTHNCVAEAEYRYYLPDKIIAVESDQLFLAPIRDLWSMFKHFSEEQVVAAAVSNRCYPSITSIHNSSYIHIYVSFK